MRGQGPQPHSVVVTVLVVVALIAILAAVLFPTFSCAREKARVAYEDATMAPGAPPPDAPPGGLAEEEPGPPDRDAWVSSTYLGGEGARERIAKLIDEGVMVGGQLVKLEAFTREYSQAFPIPTDRALALTAQTERARIIRSGDRTFLQVGLQAIKREAPRRPALNICLVIDRSGSMGSEDKMQYARQAAIEVVKRLADSDTIAVVAYDDTVDVAAAATSASNRQAVIDRIAALEPGGSTDIHAGLEAGYAEVRTHLDAEAINKVILISDGEVTAGIDDPAAFARLTAERFDEGIETTAVGMGLDYDEALMMTIAREGKGNYHFIREAETIPGIFREELEELTHTVAKALRLRIRLADDVELVRVLGSAVLEEEDVEAVKRTEQVQDERIRRELGITADRGDLDDEPGIKMMIPQFAMGASHVVMLQIEVPPGSGSRSVADVYLKYKDIVFRTNRDEHAQVTIEYTDTQDASVASIRQAVKKNVLGFETGEALQRAAALIERGEHGEAARVIDERMAVLGVAAREWHDEDLNRDGELLAAYREVIAGLSGDYAGDPELGDYLVKSLTYSGYQMTR